MGDDKRGAVSREARQGLLHQPLRFGVERAGGLVQQQDGRVLEDGARQGQPLPLAARQAQTAIADHGVVALRLRHDEVVRGRSLGGGDDVLFAGAEAAQRNVGADAVVEQRHLLADDGDRIRVGLPSVTSRTSWPSIKMRPDCTSNSRATRLMTVDLPEPERPTRAAVLPPGTVSENSLTAGSPAADGVGEADLVEGDGAGADGERPRARPIDDGRLLVEQFVDAIDRGQALRGRGAQVPSDLMGCAASSSAVTKPMKSPTVLTPLAMRQ